MRRLPLLLALVLLGCPKKPHEKPNLLLAEVKQGLSQRDAKLSSYHLAGTTRQGEQEVAFEFFYRHPNRMRGKLTRPIEREFSWDGQRLFESSTAERRFVTYENKLPPHKSLELLTRTFAPFAPEGFRAPLIPAEGATATRTTHPNAPEAIEVTVQARVEGGQLLRVVYVLRWPSLDFLAKRTESGGQAQEIRVDEERCDEALRLCFPTRLSQWAGAQRLAETQLSTVELNVPLPAESFTLSPPEGFEAVRQELVESGR